MIWPSFFSMMIAIFVKVCCRYPGSPVFSTPITNSTASDCTALTVQLGSDKEECKEESSASRSCGEIGGSLIDPEAVSQEWYSCHSDTREGDSISILLGGRLSRLRIILRQCPGAFLIDR